MPKPSGVNGTCKLNGIHLSRLGHAPRTRHVAMQPAMNARISAPPFPAISHRHTLVSLKGLRDRSTVRVDAPDFAHKIPFPGSRESTQTMFATMDDGRKRQLRGEALLHPGNLRSIEASLTFRPRPIRARRGPFESDADRSTVSTRQDNARECVPKRGHVKPMVPYVFFCFRASFAPI